MKPRNWRTYYWYRPPTLACPPKTQEQCRVMADTYVAWLAEARRWGTAEAREYVAAMDTGTLIAAENCPTKGYERKVKTVAATVAVRTVPCFSGSAPTVHWVVVRGRQVDSFLTAARAMEHAKKLAAA